MSGVNFYDNFELCPKCGADNIVEILEFVQYHPAVATTVCTRCYHEDEWAYGYYNTANKEDF